MKQILRKGIDYPRFEDLMRTIKKSKEYYSKFYLDCGLAFFIVNDPHVITLKIEDKYGKLLKRVNLWEWSDDHCRDWVQRYERRYFNYNYTMEHLFEPVSFDFDEIYSIM